MYKSVTKKIDKAYRLIDDADISIQLMQHRIDVETNRYAKHGLDIDNLPPDAVKYMGELIAAKKKMSEYKRSLQEWIIKTVDSKKGVIKIP